MSIVANAIHGFSQTVAQMRGRIPCYTITDNSIRLTYEKPSKIDKRAYDLGTYEGSQLFIKDYANPIHIDIEQQKKNIDENPKYKLMPSEKYKMFMKQHIAEQMFSFEQLKLNKIFWLVIGIAAELFLIGMVIIILVG